MFISLIVNTVITLFWQINAIKERVKKITAFEREITKYIGDGKNAYKEVTCSFLSAILHQIFYHFTVFTRIINILTLLKMFLYCLKTLPGNFFKKSNWHDLILVINVYFWNLSTNFGFGCSKKNLSFRKPTLSSTKLRSKRRRSTKRWETSVRT